MIPTDAKTELPATVTTQLRPRQDVLLVSDNGTKKLSRTELTWELVGRKCFGIATLPPEWVPPFFAVNGRHAATVDTATLQKEIAAVARELGIHGQVVVRSSGVAETMRERGRLPSAESSLEAVGTTLKALSSHSSGCVDSVHWVIQEHVTPMRQGHLSNERQYSKEKRDWVVEFETRGEAPSFMRVAVRRWRSGTDIPDVELKCASQFELITRLKHVALWATQLSPRIHFEWVWDGRSLRLVQADLAEGERGINPYSLRPLQIPTISLTSLKLFASATPDDFAQLPKLHNAGIYRALGYDMPDFFVLRSPETFRGLLAGRVSEALDHDLKELTKRPLIIRTDGTAIPSEKHEMLPRSDELRSAADAHRWLVEKFAPAIKANELEGAQLSLIAHHFIPSVAAAWARAEPGKRMVRIESLWGLPEGLYWYSHDTFEVDTQDNSVEKVDEFPVYKKLRFKGTFIAPDSTGRWIPYQSKVPFDWARSVKRSAWLREIAATTRRVADSESYPVVLMWFIDNDPRATKHPVLPWYHTQSRIDAPTAAPRRKLTVAADFRVETAQDWEELKARVGSGVRIERIVIEPKDAALVRNQKFVEAIAEFAANHHIVVELAGGVLSHAYYMLQRGGAQVECIDLFGANEEVIEYNKLVRDKIPALIQGGGEDVEVVQLRGDALLAALRQKLVEEAFEAVDAKSPDELLGELADVQEVIQGISSAIAVSAEQLQDERTRKAKKRGGFEAGVMLKRTSMPRSLSPQQNSPTQRLTVESNLSPTLTIQEPNAIPTMPTYRRADVRTIDQKRERLLTFETEVNKLGSTKASTGFSFPFDDGTRRFTVSVELTRNRSLLRGTVRIHPEEDRKNESQLKLGFEE